MSIANYITFFRVFLSPIFPVIYLTHDSLGISSIALPYALLALITISELTDAFDGYFARKYNQVTSLGKILDPMADSISRLSVFLTFTQGPVNLPLSLVFVFFYRDAMISTLRTICALKGFALAARLSGKIKAVIQAVAAFLILFLMIPHSLGTISDETLRLASSWIVAVAAAYAIFSGIEYLYANRGYIRRVLRED